MLHAPQDLEEGREPRVMLSRNHGEPGERVQLIHRAVCLDACRIFRDPLPAGETGLSLVAALGVNAVEGKARVVERFFGHVSSYDVE